MCNNCAQVKSDLTKNDSGPDIGHHGGDGVGPDIHTPGAAREGAPETTDVLGPSLFSHPLLQLSREPAKGMLLYEVGNV